MGWKEFSSMGSTPRERRAKEENGRRETVADVVCKIL